jgi:hypothetical protein
MSSISGQRGKNKDQYNFNYALVVVAGQVGCFTLLIVLAALFGGLWLDSHLHSRPMFTVGLMIISIPIALATMFWVVKTTTTKLKMNQKSKQVEEEK